MSDWVVIRAIAPEIIWARYAVAFGLKELQETFGEHWPPARARHGEEVYCWRDRLLASPPFDPAGHPAAWMSLTPDQFDPSVAHMSRGVWPDQHGQGLGRLMRDWAEGWCRERGVKTLMIAIRRSNAQHLTNTLKDDYWQHCGSLFLPVEAWLFSHQIYQKLPTFEEAVQRCPHCLLHRYECLCP